MGFPAGTLVKHLPTNAGDSRNMGSVAGLGKFPGAGNGNLLQYSCLEKSMDRVAWCTPNQLKMKHISPSLNP